MSRDGMGYACYMGGYRHQGSLIKHNFCVNKGKRNLRTKSMENPIKGMGEESVIMWQGVASVPESSLKLKESHVETISKSYIIII